MDIGEAAIETARLRFRPILMTCFAFISGMRPLVFASGRPHVARHRRDGRHPGLHGAGGTVRSGGLNDAGAGTGASRPP